MIKTEQLTKKFDKYVALDNVSCTIPDGCICGIVGSNGAGKSTLLRLLTGIYKPDSGSVFIDDMPVFDNPLIKSKLAFVPDDLFFTPGATIRKMSNLYRSVFEKFDMDKCKSLAESFKLDIDKPISTFSKGMKRQSTTLLTLATNADYLFFDETFDGFDPIVRNYVKSIICEDVLERKSTAIITSHSLRELEDVCDKLALLHKGGLILQSDVDNLKTSHFKVQVAFPFEYDEGIFNGFDYKRYQRIGSVSSMIVKGNRDETAAALSKLNPIICDILPLTLEEVFSYEMETLEYNFDISLTGMEG
ncbi:MAG: ABC transporter ATP-binding protein [Lachnospiraceae bacterium]|nr:ABC transporter ATP-binding protein [Lachnospiraceae bacterium]